LTDPADMPSSSAPPFSPKRKSTTPPFRRRPEWLEQPAIWAVLFILGVVVLAGGGNPVWARASILILIGAWVAAQPPLITPCPLFEAALLALFALGIFSSFIPAGWLGSVRWRGDLVQMGVILPATNATAPWAAGESLAQLAAGLAWLYLCWNLRLNHESRKLALWGLAWLGALLSLGAAVGNILHLKYPLGEEAVNFSYFQNRNQSALWYCLGGIVAFGLLVEGLRRRRRNFLIAAALLAPCLLALVMGRSRMALALFVVGTLAVVIVRLGRDAGKYVVGILIPLGVLGVAMMVIFTDQETLARLPVVGTSTNASVAEGSTSPEFRLLLWRDTLTLAKAQPAGVGLGQFSQIFPQYRNLSRTYQSVRHPDSDWVWLLGEVGWLGVLAAVVAVGALAARFLGKNARNSGPYRHLAVIATSLFFLHSIVDVPAHRFGTWMLAAWLLTIAAPECPNPAVSRIPGWVWRLVGVVLIVVGSLWLAASFGAPLYSSLVMERARARSDDAVKANRADDILAAVRSGLAVEPMQWWPYFQRARTALTLENKPDAALADFRIARLLDPSMARVPFTEGLLWERTSHTQAFAAWREALQREDPTPEGLWRNIYDEMRPWPDCDDYASILSKTHPLDRWEFLSTQVAPARLPGEMADELQRDPLLVQYTPAQRRDILERWAGLDATAALAYLREHPKIVDESWQIEVAALASSGHRGDAFNLARLHLPALPLPDFPSEGAMDDDALRLALINDPTRLSDGVVLVKRQIDAQNFDGALATLALLAKQPNPPPFVSWWTADLLARMGKADDAWLALQPYLKYERSLAAKKS